MFTFSFSSAFATVDYTATKAADQIATEDDFWNQQDEGDQPDATTGTIGVTTYEIASAVGSLTNAKAALVGVAYDSSAPQDYDDEYISTAEKTEKKAAYDTAIAAVKAAKTSKEVRTAQYTLKKTLTALTAKYAAYYETIYDNAKLELDATDDKDVYLLEGYGYFTLATSGKYDLKGAAGSGYTALDATTVIKWMTDNGYVYSTTIAKGMSKFYAALLANDSTTWKKAVAADYKTLKATVAELNEGSDVDFGSALKTYAGIEEVEKVLAAIDDFETKYCVAKDTTLDTDCAGANTKEAVVIAKKGYEIDSAVLTSVILSLEDKLIPNAAEIKAMNAVTLRTDAEKIACIDSVKALFTTYAELKASYPYVYYADILGSAYGEALAYFAKYDVYNGFVDPTDTVELELAKDFEAIATLAGTEKDWAYTTSGHGSKKTYSFDNSKANLEKIEALKAATDALVAKFGTLVYQAGDYEEYEALLLAAEYNANVVTTIDEKADAIDNSKVQAYLNNATVKVTTKALGNGRVRVQATIDTTSFNYIHAEMNNGATVSYKFYKNDKGYSWRTGNFTTFKGLKKGVKSYYQCAVEIKDADGNVVATKDYKASTIGVRTAK